MPATRQAYRIVLPEGQTAMALREEVEPLTRFFKAGATDDWMFGEELFACWVHRSAFRSDGWKRLPKSVLPPRLAEEPTFIKPDFIGRVVHLYRNSREIGLASLADIETFEPTAVWEAEHLSSRLRDALLGRPNHWLENMRDGSRRLIAPA